MFQSLASSIRKRRKQTFKVIYTDQTKDKEDHTTPSRIPTLTSRSKNGITHSKSGTELSKISQDSQPCTRVRIHSQPTYLTGPPDMLPDNSPHLTSQPNKPCLKKSPSLTLNKAPSASLRRSPSSDLKSPSVLKKSPSASGIRSPSPLRLNLNKRSPSPCLKDSPSTGLTKLTFSPTRPKPPPQTKPDSELDLSPESTTPHVPTLIPRSRGRASYPLSKIASLNMNQCRGIENTVERSSTKIKRSRSLHESKNRSQCVKNANSASTPNNPISGVKRSGSANRLCHKQPTPRDSEMPKKGYNAVMRPRRVSSNASEEQHSLDNGSSKENSVQGTPSDLSSPKVNTKLDAHSLSLGFSPHQLDSDIHPTLTHSTPPQPTEISPTDFDALITPQPQKSGLPDDFEEMEALLMERDHLESQLAAERKQRTALEQAKVEHEEKQCRMQDQIKALEAEIIKVDGDMVHLRSRAEDADKLADQKRALEARLIAARGAKREMDTISICSIDDDLISLSGMSIYQENGLMLNEDIHQLNKTELVQNLIAVKKEKKDLEANLKQLRCDMANEKRRHEKTVKDLMVQVRGIHMPGPPVINTEPDSQPAQPAVAEYERQLTELRTQLEAAEVHKKAQSKLVERLIGERNHHLIELARLRGDGEEATQLREEVSKLRRQLDITSDDDNRIDMIKRRDPTRDSVRRRLPHRPHYQQPTTLDSELQTTEPNIAHHQTTEKQIIDAPDQTRLPTLYKQTLTKPDKHKLSVLPLGEKQCALLQTDLIPL